MKYLLASDFDGTLLRKKEVSEEDRLAIKKWQENGHLFCLCSGRAPLTAIEEMEKWGIKPDLLITGNGGSAITMDGNLLYQHFMEAEHLHPLLDKAHELDCTGFHLHGQEGQLLIWSTRQPERTNITRAEAEKITAFTQIGSNYKGRPEVAAAFAGWVNENFPTITAHINGTYIDCTLRGIDKATGVADAAKCFGVDLDNCYTIGDQGNDLAMLLPYHGAVVETGNPEVIQKVGKSVPSVAAYINEILN